MDKLPGHSGLELSATLQIAEQNAPAKAFVSHNAIPVRLTDEDLENASAGNLVTKVIFLPSPENQELALAGVETLVSTRLDPGVDPVAQANKRGTVLAIFRLGNRQVTQETTVTQLIQQKVEPINVTLSGGEQRIVQLSTNVQRVTVANPDIVKVTSVGPKQLQLTARSAGKTSLSYEGDTGASKVQVVVREPLQDKLKELFPDLDVKAISLPNAILLRGRVADRAVADQIRGNLVDLLPDGAESHDARGERSGSGEPSTSVDAIESDRQQLADPAKNAKRRIVGT